MLEIRAQAPAAEMGINAKVMLGLQLRFEVIHACAIFGEVESSLDDADSLCHPRVYPTGMPMCGFGLGRLSSRLA